MHFFFFKFLEKNFKQRERQRANIRLYEKILRNAHKYLYNIRTKVGGKKVKKSRLDKRKFCAILSNNSIIVNNRKNKKIKIILERSTSVILPNLFFKRFSTSTVLRKFFVDYVGNNF